MSQLTYASMSNSVGEVMGISTWVEVTQEMINEFARATGDKQWIHVDVERANRESPFGGPVAHGYLTLSLLSAMAMETGVVPQGTVAAINYGLDKVRFMAAVPVGAKLRLQIKLTSFEKRDDGQYLMKTENTMEMEGAMKPVLLAESLAILRPGPNAET